MTYETMASFAQTWGMIGFVVLFGLVLVYALNPRNRKDFDEASRMPLEKD